MIRKSEQGFTLVELLVVIAIIVVLAGVVLVAINPAALLMKGRDATRLQDLDNLNKAISLSLADGEVALLDTSPAGVCGATGCSSATGTRAVDGSGWIRYTLPAAKTGLSKYIPTLPIDPSGAPAAYVFASDAANYEINGTLESPDYVAKMSTDGGDNAAVYELGTSLTILN